MKKLLQLFAVIVIGLLAIQPALAALTCPTASRCTMGMSGMGPNCPMTPALAAAGCVSGCCAQTLPPTNQSWGTIAKPKATAANGVLVVAVVLSDAPSATERSHSDPAVLNSPPRYILHRVFRI
ncbi:MAG TPA: hypothetical protein VK720_04240 [Terracidiphilus sp.]|jgi:hypothetical protein|nr:hypothetical protein [Terracidiphilus sp.]